MNQIQRRLFTTSVALAGLACLAVTVQRLRPTIALDKSHSSPVAAAKEFGPEEALPNSGNASRYSNLLFRNVDSAPDGLTVSAASQPETAPVKMSFSINSNSPELVDSGTLLTFNDLSATSKRLSVAANPAPMDVTSNVLGFDDSPDAEQVFGVISASGGESGGALSAFAGAGSGASLPSDTGAGQSSAQAKASGSADAAASATMAGAIAQDRLGWESYSGTATGTEGDLQAAQAAATLTLALTPSPAFAGWTTLLANSGIDPGPGHGFTVVLGVPTVSVSTLLPPPTNNSMTGTPTSNTVHTAITANIVSGTNTTASLITALGGSTSAGPVSLAADPATGTPEPSSAVLALAGCGSVLIVMGYRRRRQNSV